jgi:hypothetical protein
MASSSRLNQGETGKLTARISTLNKSGKVTEKITVKSNDPIRPKIVLTLTATVEEAFNPLKQEGACTDKPGQLPSVVP